MKTTRLLMVVALCLALSNVAFAGLVGVAEGGGNAAKHLLLNAAGDLVTAPTNFADIPGLGGPIQVGGRAPTCITATVSGGFIGPWYGSLRALLDGALMQGHDADTGQVPMLPGPLNGMPLSYTFLACGVVPGPHTVQMQWMSSAGMGVKGRTLIVEGR